VTTTFEVLAGPVIRKFARFADARKFYTSFEYASLLMITELDRRGTDWRHASMEVLESTELDAADVYHE
jgi:hypothetical protein